MNKLAEQLKKFLAKDRLYDWYSFNADCGQTDAFYDKETVDFEKLKALIDEFSESFNDSDADLAANKVILDIHNVQINTGDRVHFGSADFLDHRAIDGPLIFSLEYQDFIAFFDESVGAWRIDVSDWRSTLDYTECFKHLNKMLNSGRAEIASRGVKS